MVYDGHSGFGNCMFDICMVINHTQRMSAVGNGEPRRTSGPLKKCVLDLVPEPRKRAIGIRKPN